MNTRICFALLLCSAIWTFRSQEARAQAPQYVVTDLGSLGGSSYAYGVNNVGQVTGKAMLAEGDRHHMFLYTAGTMIDCAASSGFASDYSVGYAISHRGQIAGTEFNSLAFPGLSSTIRSEHALKYSGTMSVIANEGQAFGINATGDIAGAFGRRAGNGFSLYYTACLYFSQGNTVFIGTNQNFPQYPFAQAVNNTRQVVGRDDYGLHSPDQNYNGPYRAFRANAPGAYDFFLGAQAGSSSSANGINSAAQITGHLTSASGARHAFLYSGGEVKDLGALSGTSSVGYGINNAGQVTGSYHIGGVDRAFLYAAASMFDLNDLVLPAQGVSDIGQNDYGNHINDWGQIAAQGRIAGATRALLLTPRGMGTQFSGGLGDLPDGIFSSAVLAVANGALAAGGAGSNLNGTDAMSWTLVGEMEGMNFNSSDPASAGAVHGVSADGTVLVGRDGAMKRAFRMVRGSATPFLLPNLAGQAAGAALAVDASGGFAAGWSGAADESSQHAVRWDGSGVLSDEIAPLPGGSRSVGLGISGDGEVVTGWSDSSNASEEAFRWSSASGVTESLGFLPDGNSSRGLGVSGDGSSIVGRAQDANGYAAFLWTPDGGMENLGDLPGGARDAAAKGVSGDGSIVVGAGQNAGGERAFVWDRNHGLRDLQTILAAEYGIHFTGWRLTSANAISPDGGTVGGSGIDPLGNPQAWIAQLNSRTHRFIAGEGYGGGVFHTSRLGGHGSRLDLLGGSCTAPSGTFRTVTVAMQPTSAVQVAPIAGYCSDIATLSGTADDTCVVQLSYDPAIVTGVALGWFNGTEWVNASDGNTGGTPVRIDGAYDGNATLGRFGADTANHVAWAVVNHGGSFTVLALTSPPVAVVQPPTEIGATFATFHGTVNAANYQTTVVFEHGTDGNTFPKSANPSPSVVYGNDDEAVSVTVAGLPSGGTIFYRIRATNAAGTVISGVRSFSTVSATTTAAGTRDAGVTEATFKASVNTYGRTAAVKFKYWADAVPETVFETATQNLVSDTPTEVVAHVSGLGQNMKYHYAVSVEIAGVATDGGVASLTTQTNQPPSAVNDLIFYSGQVVVDPLANDSDPNDGSNVNLLLDPALVNPPDASRGVASVTNDRRGISYNPQFNVRDDDSLTYRVVDPLGASADAQVRLIAFSKRAGLYGGKIMFASGASAREGQIAVQMGGGGAISTSFMAWPNAGEGERESFVLKGVFDQRGRVTRTLNSPSGAVLTLTLQLDPDAPQMLGTFEERVNDVSTTGEIAFTLTKNANTGGLAESGLRTGFLSPPSAQASVMADGYLRMTVGKDARRGARFAGRLPDGEPFLTGARAQGRTYALSRALEQGGVFTGLVRAIDGSSGASGMMGDLLWQKRASSRARYERGGVSSVLSLSGVAYPALERGALPPLGANVRLILGGVRRGDGTAVSYRDLLMQLVPGSMAAQIVGSDPAQTAGEDIPLTRLQLKVDAVNAAFRGRFLHPATGRLVPFDGALRMPFDGEPVQGRGVFRGPGAAGSVRLEAN